MPEVPLDLALVTAAGLLVFTAAAEVVRVSSVRWYCKVARKWPINGVMEALRRLAGTAVPDERPLAGRIVGWMFVVGAVLTTLLPMLPALTARS